MKNRIIGIVAIIAIVALVGFKLAANKKVLTEKNKVVDRSGITIPVNTYKVQKGSIAGKLVLPASVEPYKEVNVTVNAQGKLTSLNIDLGSSVSKGQQIGSVDTKLKELSLKATELSVAKLEKDFQRQKSLLEGNAGTEVNFADAKYNYENAKLQADQTRQLIADAKVVAPISGIVIKKAIEEGEFVNPGNSIATVVDVATLKATVMVNEKDVYRITKGMKVQCSSDIFPGKHYEGTVTYISPKGDESHNYEVEVTMKNQQVQIKAGTYVLVEFNIENKEKALQIPKVALVEGMKNPYVYVVKNNKTEIHKVIIGREFGENIEVINGLSEGDEVVVTGQINLANGSPVEIIKNTK
jgi:RND family efflux transporter MFP subunit